MNLHKSINIKDFVVKEVVPNLKGVLKLKENEKEIFSGINFLLIFFRINLWEKIKDLSK